MPNHFLANCLHPKYRGRHLTPEQLLSAHQLLLSKDPNMMPHLCSFQAEAGPFPVIMFHEACINKLEPSVWWISVKQLCSMVNASLCDLAILLLHLPSSSASIERIFSNFGATQTKLRNRLGLEKAAKLVTCYRALRDDTEIDW